ncbi:MAG: bZIP transcription factor, partial [Pirellula sp.]
MDWSTLTPILTFVGGGLMTFTAHRLLDRVRHVDREASLERANLLLESENTELKKKVLTLQDEVAD